MAEPASSSAAGVAGWKLFGALGGASALAWIVVVSMRRPCSDAEWRVSLISTLVASIAGGAWLLHTLGLHDLAAKGPVGMAVLIGLAFVSGLPAWALVRAFFLWLARRDGKDLGELAADAVDELGKLRRPLQ